MSEKGLLSAIISCRCPQCREGRLFTHKPYNLRGFGKMPENCPTCGMRYESEPGFFYGAMYVSYALSVGVFLFTVCLLYFVFGDPALEVYITVVGVVSLVLYPLTFRYARTLFVHLFSGARYDPSKTDLDHVS